MQQTITFESIQKPPPTPSRSLSAAAIAVALFFALAWLPVAGLALGIAGWLYSGHAQWVKLGFAGGMAVGAIFSLLLLCGGFLVGRLGSVTTEQDINKSTVTYAPLGTAPGQDIRIVPLSSMDRLIEGVREEDLRFFIEGLRDRGHTQRAWLGVQLPSGERIDPLKWYSLCVPLRKAGIIRGVAERKKGYLVTKDAAVILAQLHLWDPYSPT